LGYCFVRDGRKAIYGCSKQVKMPVYMLLRSAQNDGVNAVGTSGELALIEVLANSYWHDYFD
jgi:hypothetical protein